jgi:hypothetical protein
VLQEAGEHLNSLDDVEEKLLAAKDESKKFHTYRAIRIVRVIKKALPGMLGGRMDLGPLISSYMKSTGLINRIDTSGLPSNLKKALAYSLLRSLYKKHKEEDNPQLRAMVLLMNGPLFAPVEPAGEIDKGLLEMLVACNGVGMGFCLGAEHGIDLNPEITTQATLRMDFVTEDEIAVRAKDMRPYRAKLRPPLSA